MQSEQKFYCNGLTQNDADTEDFSSMFDELSKGALVGARQPKEKIPVVEEFVTGKPDVKENIV